MLVLCQKPMAPRPTTSMAFGRTGVELLSKYNLLGAFHGAQAQAVVAQVSNQCQEMKIYILLHSSWFVL